MIKEIISSLGKMEKIIKTRYYDKSYSVVFGGAQMNVVCEGIRKEEQQDGYYYGCKFRGLTRCEEQVIRKFVFEEQLRSRMLRCANAN